MGLTEANQVLTLNNLRHTVQIASDKDWERCCNSSNDGSRGIWSGHNIFGSNNNCNEIEIAQWEYALKDEKLREKEVNYLK